MTRTASPTYLVTGANGTIGARTVAALRAQGATVRAGVRRLDQGAPLAALGATPVHLDFTDPASLAAAFDGVDRVLLLTPFVEDALPLVDAALSAAQAAGVDFVVRLSAQGAAEDAPFALARAHAAAEGRVRQSGLRWAVLRPTFYMDNTLGFQGGAIAQTGAFYGANDGAVAWISSVDVGAAAAAVLADPDAYAGQTYGLTGGEALTQAQLAEQIAEAAGRPVGYVNVGPAALRASLEGQGTPAWQVQALMDLETIKGNGWAAGTTDAVQRLLGRPPLTFAAHLGHSAAAVAALWPA